MAIQLMIAGNLRHHVRILSPTGDMQNTTCSFERTCVQSTECEQSDDFFLNKRLLDVPTPSGYIYFRTLS